MTDGRNDDELEMQDEDRLPWLEAVEEEDQIGGPSLAKLAAAIVIGLVAIGVIVGGLFWLGNRGQPGGNGQLIAAPEGDYKVRPSDPGGMEVEGEGDTAFAASEGAQPQGNLNVDSVPEVPVTRGQPEQVPAPVRPTPARPATARPPAAPAQPAPAAPGATVQLGAFSSEAGANRAWTALAARFRYLAPLSHSVVAVQAGGRTLYRLRASGPDAGGICRRLSVAGEACTLVG